MEITNKTGGAHYFHCLDCDLTVHENDRENHISGGRHKYRTRQKQSETNQIDYPLKCEMCATKFTDLHFYTIHQGSKTHKRNLRRIQKSKKGLTSSNKDQRSGVSTPKEFRQIGRRVPIQGIERYLSISDFKDSCDYKSVREKYRPRNTKNPEGNNKVYICSVTAYWAVSLALTPTVRDFKIALNDKEWGDFGDVVVEIELQGTKEQPALRTTFAIQFKDISNNIKTIDSLAEKRFGLAKYFAQANSIKLRRDVENKKFVVFTTSIPSPNMVKQINISSDILHKTKQKCDCKGSEKDISVISKPLSNRQKLLINTSDDNDSIFIFFLTDKMHTLPKMYLYTHQKKQKHFGSWIDHLVSGSLGYGERKVDIHREFIKYMEYWSDGDLGGSYKLKKEDVLVKLGHLLLYNFKMPPAVKSTQKENYVIWQQAVNSVDITILKQDSGVITKVCRPINSKIEQILDLKIDTTTTSVDLDQTTIEKIVDPVLKMYLFEEIMGDIQDCIPLELVYDFFWKAGLVPLLLQVEDFKDQEHILNIISLLKSSGLIRRYFLLTPDHNIKNTLRYYKTLTFFVNVDDIASKIPSVLLDRVKISVTDQFSLSLKDIQETDMFFQKTVSAHEFFDMTLGKYSFKSFDNHLARNDGQDTQLVLGNDTLAKMREEVESEDQETKPFLRGIKPNLFCN